MSKQSEIDRRWRVYQNSHLAFAAEVPARKGVATQTERPVQGGNREQSAWREIRRVRVYAVMLSGLAFLGGVLAIRHLVSREKVDQQDWDDWASQAESNGGSVRSY